MKPLRTFCQRRSSLKRDAENTTLDTSSKTDLALFWACNQPIRVSWLLWLHDRHIKKQQSADPYLFVAKSEDIWSSFALCIYYVMLSVLLTNQELLFLFYFSSSLKKGITSYFNIIFWDNFCGWPFLDSNSPIEKRTNIYNSFKLTWLVWNGGSLPWFYGAAKSNLPWMITL